MDACSSCACARARAASVLCRFACASSNVCVALIPRFESDSVRSNVIRASSCAALADCTEAFKVEVLSWKRMAPTPIRCPSSNSIFSTRPSISGVSVTDSFARNVPTAERNLSRFLVSTVAASTMTTFVEADAPIIVDAASATVSRGHPCHAKKIATTASPGANINSSRFPGFICKPFPNRATNAHQGEKSDIKVI